MPDARRVRQVWLASSVLGLLLGLGHATWQFSVESGQVIAGLVTYPPSNPFYVYHLKLWTLVVQLSGLLLRAGMSEIAVSYAISGLLGLVSISALALVVYALTEDRAVSLLAPFFIHLTPAPQYGVGYPIWLFGVSHTYGVLGLAFDLLVLALLGCGRYGAGLLLLGLAPAVHPSLGAWLWLLVGAVVLADAASRRALLPHWRWIAAGTAVTAVSALVQLWGLRGAAHAAVDVKPYFDAFVRDWDAHRQPIDLGHHGLWVGLGTGAIALLWRRAFAHEVPEPARFLLSALGAGSAAAVALLLVSLAGLEHLPRALLVLMPNRLVNIDVLASTAVLIALLSKPRGGRWTSAGLLVLLAGLLLAHRSRYLELGRALGAGSAPWERLHVLVTAAALLVVAARWSMRRGSEGVPAPRDPVRLVSLAILASAPVLAFVLAVQQPRELKDRTNNRVFADLARGDGVIAPAAGLSLVQLRTRRPIILDATGLDMLPYAWEAAPEMARILDGVYGIDFFRPPNEARHTAMIPFAHNRAVWEERTNEDWKKVRRDFGVRQVLAHRDWDLQLPAGAANKDLLVYAIPD